MWGVQLFGCEPESAAAAVRAIEPLEPRLYDLNCGCSVPKVLKSGAGAALLRDPERIYRLVAAMKVETQAPVSVKLRSGWDLESLNYPETAAAAVAGGASLVTLHPRIRSQGFGGKAVWDHIRILKNALKVPVVGSGDLFRPEDALRMLATTGCDGVMFARGALGNPFVFACSRAVLCDEPLPDPAPSPAKLCTALEQLRRSLKYKKEETACKEMRKHFCYYTRGVPGGAQLRKQIATATRYVEYESVVKEYLHRTDGIDKGENPIER